MRFSPLVSMILIDRVCIDFKPSFSGARLGRRVAFGAADMSRPGVCNVIGVVDIRKTGRWDGKPTKV